MPYPKPSGYRSIYQPYTPFNQVSSAVGIFGGNMSYAPGLPSIRVPFNFSAAPPDLSTFHIPDGATVKIFTFTYSGSPGAGIIPLVAGGGTAAQAATASQVALASQLTKWTVTNPSAGVLVLVSKLGYVPNTSNFTMATNLTMGAFLISFAPVVPGRFGKNYCFLPG